MRDLFRRAPACCPGQSPHFGMMEAAKPNRIDWILAAIFGLILIGYAGWIARQYLVDPELVFLCDDGRARWIVPDEPVNIDVHPGGTVTRAFRIRLNVTAAPAAGTVHVRALKRWNMLLDGKRIAGADLAGWKTEYEVPIATLLGAGEHELKVYVQNETGAVALRIGCPELGLYSDERWQSTSDDKTWIGTRLASTRLPAPISRQFESVGSALTAKLPFLGAVFAAIAGALLAARGRLAGAAGNVLSPAVVRWLAMGAWVILGANNLFKLPAAAGFDVGAHAEYVNYLLAHHRVPLATDGFQMFQPPLYYTLVALCFGAVSHLFSANHAFLLLRAPSLLAGMLQIEVCYRATKLVFPGRRDLQILGIIFAAFVPVNIYLSQYMGNEPLASLFASGVILLCLRQLDRGDPATAWPFAWIGLLLGLALLTKFSAVILLAPLLFLFVWRFLAAPGPAAGAAKATFVSCAIVLGTAAAVAGWYYVRNWILIGRPFVGGWDLHRGFPWWQDPGFRMAGDCLRFGDALAHPISANALGFWDGLYATFWCDSGISSAVDAIHAPRWNYSFLLASVGLAVLPTAAIFLGAVRALRSGTAGTIGRALVFSLCCGVAYLGALFHHFLTLPYQGALKALYIVGGMPAYTLLAVAGLDVLGRTPWARALVYGAMGAWATAVFCAYLARA